MGALGPTAIRDGLLVVCFAGGLVVWAGGASKDPKRGEAVAVSVTQGPACDGTMDDPVWERCPPWPLGACTSETPQKYKAWARVLFDRTHVHVGVYCEETDTDGLAMKAARRDDPVWNDDSVEVFLRSDPQQSYCQFVVNPRGTLYDARNRDAAWNSSAEARASVKTGNAWTATLRIPLRDLGAYVGENQTWRMNVYRSRPARKGEPVLQYSWSIMSENDYHAEHEFGVVTGVHVPKREDGVTRVRAVPPPKVAPPNRGKPAGGVTVYHKMFFNEDTEGWTPANDGGIRLENDAIDGKALHVACERRWAGAQHAISVVGSRDLKIAALMKARNLASVGINVYDVLAGDNTTAYGYCYLEEDRWKPVLYRLDRFRYNSRTEGFVSAKTAYRSVSFYGPSDARPGMALAIDNFVMYRGADKLPPDRVNGLRAKATTDGVLLTWEPVTDNVAPQVYIISRADERGAFAKIAESHATSYLDTAAGKGNRRYRVFAVDFEENYGPWSAAASVESVSAARPQEPTREERDRFVYGEHVRQVHARGVGKVRKGHATLFGDSLTGATSYRHCAESAFRTLTVNAFGYPSMKTSFGREKVREILQKDNPEFMFILYGTNNNKAEKLIPAAMDDLAAIVRACENRGTVAVLGTIPPRGWTPESGPEANFNRHVVELCRKLQIPTGYIFEDFQAAGDRRKHLSGDGVHWTGSGMEIAGKAWGRTLDQIRFALRDQK